MGCNRAMGNKPKFATLSMPGGLGCISQERPAVDAWCILACWERGSYRVAMLATQALAVLPRLPLFKMKSDQQTQQQQSVNFKSGVVYFRSRLCASAVQTSAAMWNLRPITWDSFIQLDSFPCFAAFLASNLVQQVVLDSHQNLTNH